MKLLLATRSGDKLREIRTILRHVPDVRLLDLNDAGLAPDSAEDHIENYESFEENALAKALYFHERTGLATVADDSGLEVDALQGRPGVRTKRFSPRSAELEGEALDRENVDHLLRKLGDLDLARRSARYVCVAALVRPGEGAHGSFRGEAEGLILGLGRGKGGFGYDPVFLDPASGKTFAELTPRQKDARSHRGTAFRALARHLADTAGRLAGNESDSAY